MGGGGGAALQQLFSVFDAQLRGRKGKPLSCLSVLGVQCTFPLVDLGVISCQGAKEEPMKSCKLHSCNQCLEIRCLDGFSGGEENR